MAKEKAQQEQKTGVVKVRVLVDCEVGKCNTVTTIDAKDVQALAGKVDASPEAVAYVESLDK